MKDESKSKSLPEEFEDLEPLFSCMLNCPVQQYAKKAIRSGRETQLALRQLHQSLMNCENCLAFGRCELREIFNMQVDQVIAEINDEWGWS